MNKHLKCLLKVIGVVPLGIVFAVLVPTLTVLEYFLILSGCIAEKGFSENSFFDSLTWYQKL